MKGRLKLIDFGIASSIESDIMTSVIKDTRIGTFNFIAPEAIQDLSGGGEVYPRGQWAVYYTITSFIITTS